LSRKLIANNNRPGNQTELYC